MAMVWLGESADVSREQLGGKAYGINRMLSRGLPVPPAFTLTCDECARFHSAGRKLHDDVVTALASGIARLERATGRRFGADQNPMLVSVRSGAARSMPGMMDTILNLGITDEVQRALTEQSGDPVYAQDTTERFRQQYEQVVGTPPPADPITQLHSAVCAVFESWHSERASAYRAHHGLDESGGTSVTVQAMVYGNLDEQSGAGVLFSRNPLTGAKEPYGEWLPRGQGEDVVSGRCNALPLTALAERQPDIYAELIRLAGQLEHEGGDVQDIEFTVESGRLYLLQTRPANRSAVAAVRFAVDLHDEGMLSEQDALARITPAQVSAILSPRIGAEVRGAATVLARGEPASPGVAFGRIVTDIDEAEALSAQGIPVVLARITTDPNDVAGMIAASAIVTEIGGATSHAAVVSRELYKPCVVGCGEGTVDRLRGREVTVDGSTGDVFAGVLELTETPENSLAELARVAEWERGRLGSANSPLTIALAAAQLDESTSTTEELSVLQTIRLKGRPSLDQLAAALCADTESARRAIDRAIDRAIAGQMAIAAGGTFKLTPAGRDRLTELLAAQRRSLDLAALTRLYADFDPFNSQLKVIVTAWQMREPDVPNDHSDEAYDAEVVQRLSALHHQFTPWLQRLEALDSRLARYRGRLDRAASMVEAGDRTFIAKPIADSYHTVWFELHQELIELLGRDRATEAAAGRAV